MLNTNQNRVLLELEKVYPNPVTLKQLKRTMNTNYGLNLSFIDIHGIISFLSGQGYTTHQQEVTTKAQTKNRHNSNIVVALTEKGKNQLPLEA